MSFPRASGILLHPTSLPSRGGIGDFGPAAYAFADFLASARQGLWQVLPLGPLGFGNSPYSSTSAFAGNPLLISLERLADRGWIDRARIDALSSGSNRWITRRFSARSCRCCLKRRTILCAPRCQMPARDLRPSAGKINGGSMTSFSSTACARVSNWRAGPIGRAS